MNNFKKIVKMPQFKLKRYCHTILEKMGYKEIYNEDGYLYAPGEIPVLLVAHLDTVHKKQCYDVCISDTGVVMSPQGIGGDDRCGVWMILEIVKELKCHVLFTEDEEIGGIGARVFANSKHVYMDVNYMIEFDRKGSNDAVYYDLDNEEFEDFISQFGFKTAFGSFSDICTVAPAVGVAAVNLSSGYYEAHTVNEFVDYNVMVHNVERAKEIISTKTDTFEWNEISYVSKYASMYKWGSYSGFVSNGNYMEEFEEIDVNILDPDKYKTIYDTYKDEYSEFVYDEQGNVYGVDLELGYAICLNYIVDEPYDVADEYTVLVDLLSMYDYETEVEYERESK